MTVESSTHDAIKNAQRVMRERGTVSVPKEVLESQSWGKELSVAPGGDQSVSAIINLALAALLYVSDGKRKKGRP